MACGIFSCSMRTLYCGMWDLVPWPGIKPRSPALGAWSLSHWTISSFSTQTPRASQTNQSNVWLPSLRHYRLNILISSLDLSCKDKWLILTYLDLSCKLQSGILSCLLDTSTWIFHWHLKLTMPRTNSFLTTLLSVCPKQELRHSSLFLLTPHPTSHQVQFF